jgi:hypothetical protein
MKRHSHAQIAVVLFCTFSFLLFGDSQERLDPERPQLAKMKDGDRYTIQEYYSPFLICQTGVVAGSDRTVDSVTESMRRLLRKTALPFKGHYSKIGIANSKISTESLSLPKQVTTGSQVNGLADCNKEFCIMKLQTQKEKAVLSQAKERLPVFHQMVVDRVKAFLDKNELTGYEDRANNKELVIQMLHKMPYLEILYPNCTRFLEKGFWNRADPSSASCQVVDSFLREEMLILPESILQPILRISEVIEFAENGKHFFFEFHIYTNHYFDSSARVYEIFPLKKSPFVSITDLMEIDELSKSSVVRFLYMGKMQNAVTNYQKKEISEVISQ